MMRSLIGFLLAMTTLAISVSAFARDHRDRDFREKKTEEKNPLKVESCPQHDQQGIENTAASESAKKAKLRVTDHKSARSDR
jgi:hypothetical protein